MGTPVNSGCQSKRGSCCACTSPAKQAACGLSRRGFLGGVGGAALGSWAVSGLTWSSAAAAQAEGAGPAPRRTLVVKPILVYALHTRQKQTSWRPWGGIQTQQDADQEMVRIQAEIDTMRTQADFPVTFLPVSGARGPGDIAKIKDAVTSDVVIIYAAGGGTDTFDAIGALGKNVIMFLRHRSGPTYLWYEIAHPIQIRRFTDRVAIKNMGYQDIVVDKPDELLWRLRAFCGLKDAIGCRIVAIGGGSGWAMGQKAVDLAKDRFKIDVQNFSYDDLGKLIKAAMEDPSAVGLAKKRAAEYLKADGVKLETETTFVENAFLLEQIFRAIMAKAGCRAITVNHCMGTIMPISQTTACLSLSLLNDAGYMAFCESDFVVIPSGILLAGISGRPMFLNDPTYPHHGMITLAHCTAPRKLDGKDLDPVRILTHFESDYGAAPKVEMRKGMKVTNIVPDFQQERWVGLSGEIIDAPFMPICRSQIDISFKADSEKFAEMMPGFHWMTCYGDYLKEVGYALGKTKIAWESLG
jgi:hypothetical protein